MKITCRHGYYIFEEKKTGDLSDFVSLFELPLVQVDNYFTFEALQDAPDFSLNGSTYLDADAIKSFAGKPWEVMRENELVFDFNNLEVVDINSIDTNLDIEKAGRFYLSSGLILAGSVTDDGSRVTDYAAHFDKDTMQFRYSFVGITL